VETRFVDLDKLRASEALARAGLQVQEDFKFNPRLLVLGIPKDMTTDEIRQDLISLNLDGTDNPEVKVIYRYAPIEGSSVTRCVLEAPPVARTKFMSASRIYLGFSSCAFKDHVRVRHCYKCLAFGYFATDCAGGAHCGHCSGEHEMRGCPNRGAGPICYNCKRSNLSDLSHAALDGSKCPILKRRLTNKVLLTNYG